MLLQDLVAAERPLQVQTPDRKIHDLPGAAALKESIAAAPVRYVLDDAAAALVTHTAFAEKNAVDSSLDLLRVPSTAFWVEWHDEGRARIMAELGVADPMGREEKRGRAGAFVQAEENGRRGEIFVLWENAEGYADLSPFSIEFDFENDAFALTPHENELTRFVNVDQIGILNTLYANTRFRLSNPWRDYYQRSARTVAEFNQFLETNVAAIAAEAPFIAAFCLVLSARGALRYQPSALDKINASRLKKGKSPLLEHVSVSLELSATDEHVGSTSGVSRTAPRLHHVCGHIVRRGDRLHWRRAHLRGNPTMGLISSRTIQVRVGRASDALAAGFGGGDFRRTSRSKQ